MRHDQQRSASRSASMAVAVVFALCAGAGSAAAEPAAPSGVAIAEVARSADAALYNVAQNNLVKGNYAAGLEAMNTLATAAPDDANVAALQVFYASATGATESMAESSARLHTLSPALAASVERALTIIGEVAEENIDFDPVTSGSETAIVVLGLGLNGDGSMQSELVERLRSAVATADRTPESPIVVTGGNPMSDVTEADAMSRWLTSEGIDPDRIHAEPTANSTVQNAQRVTSLLPDIGAKNIVLATSAGHLRRAISNFEIAGSDVIGAAAVDPAAAPEVPVLLATSRLGLTVDATKVIGIPRTY